ncbi:MAG: hypothetical protein PVG39_09610 [Desulfobacteraceae bacterium]|jgi:hypothetical protein
MSISVDELATEAMKLSGESRALLAEKLVESLDQEMINKLWLTPDQRPVPKYQDQELHRQRNPHL